ncbi:MAG: DNA-directed RNA polymerase subunit omega [Breznakibacter sp.]|jgi:DNA-directed RNA polymerase subunit K/omega|nr:DNA-directed RNA polymerase subunit omega [Breznakibacter sp.]
MDYKKLNAPGSTITWNTELLSAETGNIYESVVICAKRANQIGVGMKEELTKKLQDFASLTDNLEEVFENREQIEISRYYERLPKPVSISVQEFSEGKIEHKYPSEEV